MCLDAMWRPRLHCACTGVYADGKGGRVGTTASMRSLHSFAWHVAHVHASSGPGPVVAPALSSESTEGLLIVTEMARDLESRPRARA